VATPTKEEYQPVVFEDSQGNEISNDPVWLAKQRLAEYGVDASDNSAEIAAKDAEIEALKAQLAAAQTPAEADEEETDEAGARTYGELDSKGLKALAKERNVDIAGLKTVGEVRSALVDADAKASVVGQ
jgi:hypothetical protein